MKSISIGRLTLSAGARKRGWWTGATTTYLVTARRESYFPRSVSVQFIRKIHSHTITKAEE